MTDPKAKKFPLSLAEVAGIVSAAVLVMSCWLWVHRDDDKLTGHQQAIYDRCVAEVKGEIIVRGLSDDMPPQAEIVARIDACKREAKAAAR